MVTYSMYQMQSLLNLYKCMLHFGGWISIFLRIEAYNFNAVGLRYECDFTGCVNSEVLPSCFEVQRL